MPSRSGRRPRSRDVKQRDRAPESPRAERVAGSEARRPLPRWQWRTFPVFFALVTGLLVASILNRNPDTAALVVYLVAVAGFGYGLAHLFVTNVVVAGRLRRGGETAAPAEVSADAPDDAWEEETVYPDEAPTR